MADAASDGPGRDGSSAKLAFKSNDLCALRPLDGHFRRALFVSFLHIAERLQEKGHLSPLIPMCRARARFEGQLFERSPRALRARPSRG